MKDDTKSHEVAKAQETGEEAQSPGRRKALKAILAAGGVAAVAALPAKWNPAVVETLADPDNCGQGHERGRGRGHGRGRGRGHDGCDTPPTSTPPPCSTSTPDGSCLPS